MDIEAVGWFVGGLVLLGIGAEIFVRGAAGLASAWRISPLVIGLTVVAFGTGAPELAFSVGAALRGQADMAVANAVGSNILNVLAILGFSAMLKPLVVSGRLVWGDVPLMVITSTLVLVLGWDGRLSQVEGLGLFVGMVVYTAWIIYKSRVGHAEIEGHVERRYSHSASTSTAATTSTIPVMPEASVSGSSSIPLTLDASSPPPAAPAAPSGGWMAARVALAIVGVLLLTGGAEATVRGAFKLADWLKIDTTIIGLTIVAAGTALPEAATTIVAAIRGQRDIAVGNIIGSNIFNVLGVLGLSAAVARGGVGLPISPALLRVDIPIMIAVSVACLPIFVSGHMISRREGLILFVYYLAYLGYYWLKATRSAGLQSYQIVVVAFLVPLTVWYIFMSTARHIRRQRWGGDVPPGRL